MLKIHNEYNAITQALFRSWILVFEFYHYIFFFISKLFYILFFPQGGVVQGTSTNAPPTHVSMEQHARTSSTPTFVTARPAGRVCTAREISTSATLASVRTKQPAPTGSTPTHVCVPRDGRERTVPWRLMNALHNPVRMEQLARMRSSTMPAIAPQGKFLSAFRMCMQSINYLSLYFESRIR